MRTRVLTGALAAAAAALVLAGCGGGTESSSPPAPAPPGAAPQHNQSDVTFAQGMIPHHAQAIEMAQLAEGRAQSEEVKALARKIADEQRPEIETMTGWLKQWGAQVPPTDMPGMDHGNMGNMGTGMQGMMTPQQMQQMQQASGPAFDRMFLQMMIEHHRGAVTMAETEVRDGQYPPAKQLAQRIINDQQAEIQQMQELLTRI